MPTKRETNKNISEDRQKSLVGSPPTHKDEKQIEDEQKIVNKSKVIFLVIDQIGGRMESG